MQQQLVLVVDDDAPILRLVRGKLEADGYRVVTAKNGQEAVAAAEEHHPDLIIMDIMMPVMNGLDAMREIRRESDTPIILLTARSGGRDTIQGLDAGADDYISKPFDPDELSARIAAVLRRAGGHQPDRRPRLDYGRLVIDLDQRQVHLNGEEVTFSRTEWEVLSLLAENAGRVMLHGDVLSRIWGPEFRDEVYYLRTWISRIRKKLDDTDSESPLIRTFPGIGYRLEAPESHSE
ncbi:MAG: response regulator transcription factor [Chloroflexota bacterium]